MTSGESVSTTNDSEYVAFAPIDPYRQRIRKDLAEKLETAPVDLGAGVELRTLPDWIRQSDALKTLNKFHRHWVKASTHCLTAVAGPRGDREADMFVLRRLLDANLALWMARPCGWGFHIVLFFEQKGSGWSEGEAYSNPILTPHPEYEHDQLGIDHVVRANELNLAFNDTESKATVGIAKSFLANALHEPHFLIRYPLLWVGLEALFGADIEIAYRISLRIGLFLSNGSEEAKRLYHQAREGYRWRSRIVHGNSLELTEDHSLKILLESEQLLRLALLRIFSSEDLISRFNSRGGRQDYLDELVFAGSSLAE